MSNEKNSKLQYIKLSKNVVEMGTNYPIWILTITLIVTSFFGSYLPQLKVASTVQGLLPQDSQELVTFNDMRDRYGKSDYVILAIIGKPVINIAYLEALRDLHRAIEKGMPYLDEVESLFNARHIYGLDDEVVIENFLQKQPKTAEDLEWLRRRLDGSQSFYGRLINDTEDTSAIFIRLLNNLPSEDALGATAYRPISELEIAEALAALDSIVNEFESRFDAEIVLAGETTMAAVMNNAVAKDLQVFIGIGIIVVCIILGGYFGRISGVVLPMLVMGVSIVISMGMLPLLGFEIQLTTSVLPSFLLTVCVGATVHLLTHFYRDFDSGLSKRDALSSALARCRFPIMMTSLTTSAGLVSLAASSVVPIKTLGIIAGTGCLIAWLATVIVLPALIVTVPIRRASGVSSMTGIAALQQYLITACFRVSVSYPRLIIAAFFAVSIPSIIFGSKLQVTNNPQGWFDEKAPIRVAIDRIEDNLSGSIMFEIVIDTGQPQGIYDPNLLRKVDAALQEIEGSTLGGIEVGRANSILELLKETNLVLHGNSAEYFSLPLTRAGIAQSMLLVELDRAEDLYQYTNETFSEIRVLLLTTAAGAKEVMYAQDVIEATIRDHTGYTNSVRFTGLAQILPKLLLELGNTLIVSIMIGVLLISLMMILALKSVWLGILAMIPNLFPSFIMFGFMYAFEIPLDIFTVVLAPIALGIAVDDTMHFMHSVRSSHAAHGCTREAIRESFLSVGQALFVTSLTLICGFLVFTLSDLISLSNFGLLMSLSVLMALIADVLLAPALLMVFLKDKPIKDIVG